MGILYTLFVGIPYCVLMVTFGLLACATIIGVPVGLTMIALGFKGVGVENPDSL